MKTNYYCQKSDTRINKYSLYSVLPIRIVHSIVCDFFQLDLVHSSISLFDFYGYRRGDLFRNIFLFFSSFGLNNISQLSILPVNASRVVFFSFFMVNNTFGTPLIPDSQFLSFKNLVALSGLSLSPKSLGKLGSKFAHSLEFLSLDFKEINDDTVLELCKLEKLRFLHLKCDILLGKLSFSELKQLKTFSFQGASFFNRIIFKELLSLESIICTGVSNFVQEMVSNDFRDSFFSKLCFRRCFFDELGLGFLKKVISFSPKLKILDVSRSEFADKETLDELKNFLKEKKVNLLS